MHNPSQVDIFHVAFSMFYFMWKTGMSGIFMLSMQSSVVFNEIAEIQLLQIVSANSRSGRERTLGLV